jgi:hypothetical protein
MGCPEWTSRHDQPTVRAARKFRDGGFEGVGVIQIDRAQLHPNRCYRLDCSKLADSRRYGGIPQNCCSRHARCDLLEYFKPFRGDRVFERCKSSGIAAGACQAFDQARSDRVYDSREYNRHCPGCLLQYGQAGASIGKDDIRSERDQLPCVSTVAFGITRAPANLEVRAATISPT